jgi:hypothetical protein
LISIYNDNRHGCSIPLLDQVVQRGRRLLHCNPSSGKMHEFFFLKFPDSEQILPSTQLMRRVLMCLDPENTIAVTSVYCLLNIKIVSFQQLFPAWKDRFPAVLYRAPAHSIERSHTSSGGCPAILFLSNQLEEFLFCL